MSELDPAQTPSGATPSGAHAAAPVSKAERARIAREALVGKTIAGRYLLRSLLGHGGMGAVYEGEQLNIGKKVAIKFVDPEFATDEQIRTRFAREAKAMSTIESPHIVSVLDAGNEEGRPYLVMELLRGEDLGQRLRRTSRVPLKESLHIVAMVLKGLSKAHGAGIVHRDLKPDNIFLVKNAGDDDFVKIVDFGVSKIERPRNRTSPLALTGRGTVLGTPFYMSPEQAQAIPDLDGRADLFSVGTILFECLAGRPPFTGETYEQVILSICMRDAPLHSALDATIPTNVSHFVSKALARDRAQRFASADEMLAALHDLSPEEKTRVPADPPANKTMVAGGAGSVNALAAANVTAPTPTSVKPFKGASTQIAGSADATAQATPIGMRQAAALVTRPVTPPAPMPAPTMKSDYHVAAGLPPKRSSSAVIATAVVAALLGVLATFAIISVLAKKVPASAPAPTAPTAATAPIAPSAPTAPTAPTTPSSASVAPIPPPPSGAALTPMASAEPVVAVSAAPRAAPAPKPLGAPNPAPPPKPKPSGKSLDISRDLP
jgi:serine/threonine-protein kinase